VSVIDTGQLDLTRTIKVGQRPRGIEFTRDGKFVLSRSAMTTRSRSSDTKPSRWWIPCLRPRPEHVHPGCRRQTLYVANENDNTVTIIDLEKRVPPRRHPGRRRAEGMAISPDGKI